MGNKAKKYSTELDDHDCQLILENAKIPSELLKATLTRLAQIKGMHTIRMTENEMSKVAVQMEAAIKVALPKSKKAKELGAIRDELESWLYDLQN